MASVFSSLVRGAVGVAAAVLLVAVTWTLYINRDAVIAAGRPVLELISPRSEPTPAAPAPAAQVPPAAQAPPTEQAPADQAQDTPADLPTAASGPQGTETTSREQ